MRSHWVRQKGLNHERRRHGCGRKRIKMKPFYSLIALAFAAGCDLSGACTDGFEASAATGVCYSEEISNSQREHLDLGIILAYEHFERWADGRAKAFGDLRVSVVWGDFPEAHSNVQGTRTTIYLPPITGCVADSAIVHEALHAFSRQSGLGGANLHGEIGLWWKGDGLASVLSPETQATIDLCDALCPEECEWLTYKLGKPLLPLAEWTLKQQGKGDGR